MIRQDSNRILGFRGLSGKHHDGENIQGNGNVGRQKEQQTRERGWPVSKEAMGSSHLWVQEGAFDFSFEGNG